MNSIFNIQFAWSALIALGTIFIHIIFAIAVLDDAAAIQEKGKKTTFVNGTMWALSVLLGGVFIALAYWVIHHSTLRSSSESKPLN